MIEIVTDKDINEIFDSKNKASPVPNRIYNDGRSMTREEAREILETSREIAQKTQDGIAYHNKVGEFYKELPEGFSFIVYPYTSEKPINPLFAFDYWVRKDTGKVIYGTSPIPKDELEKLQMSP